MDNRNTYSMPAPWGGIILWEENGELARIYPTIDSIQPGQWMSYSQVAQTAGNPAAARAVGQALAHNLFPILIGCHRVCASAQLEGFDILKPETFRPQAYLGAPELAAVAQWLRLADFSL